MKAIDQLKARLTARADMNGDGKIDKHDLNTVISQMAAAFEDDKAENVGWLVLGFAAGVVVTLLYGWLF